MEYIDEITDRFIERKTGLLTRKGIMVTYQLMGIQDVLTDSYAILKYTGEEYSVLVSLTPVYPLVNTESEVTLYIRKE